LGYSINIEMIALFIVIAIGGYGLIISSLDMLKWKKSAEVKKANYHSLFQHNQDGIIIIDRNGFIKDGNSSVLTITGYSLTELEEKNFHGFIHSEDLPYALQNFNESLNGIANEFQIRIYHKNKSVITIQVKNVPYSHNSKVIGVYAIIRDITTQKQIQLALQEKDEKYRLVASNMSDLVCLLSPSGHIQFASPSHMKILGYEEDDLKGRLGIELIHHEDLELVQKHINQLLTKKETVRAIFRFQHKSGTFVPLESHAIPLIDIDGNVTNMLITSRDISERLAKEHELMASEMKYRLIAENSSDLIRIVGVDGMISYASPSHYTILGYTPEEIVGKPYDTIAHPDDKEILKTKYLDHVKHGNKVTVEYRYQSKQGEWIWLEANSSPVLDSTGDLLHFVVVSRVISERKQYEDQLKSMAYYDLLTEVPNRRLFHDRLASSIQHGIKYKTNLALFYLDFDRFKWVNDTYGHETGDKLLKEFVKRVKTCIREDDTIARLGGDEFAIIIDGFNVSEEVEEIAEKIIESLRVPWCINGEQFITTSSIGISILPSAGTEMHDLISKADQALYYSKEKGKNMYHFYSDMLAGEIERKMYLEDGLKGAILKEQFHLVFQPQMSIVDERMIGVECLLRYTHPKLGSISPVEFIPLCQKIGILDEVTRWVFREAIIQQNAWKLEGYGPIKIAINIPPATLEKEDFLEYVSKYLNDYSTDPTSIEFEITEDGLFHNIDYISNVLERLKMIGIKISLDDFGTGYSSLRYLKELPIDKVKIDRSFISGVPNQEKEIAIIESIISLTNRLKGEVLCEGVETEKQLAFLKEIGCSYAQGYYFSKPLTREELESTFISPHRLSS
jgi:diguanylate cyclase (GGDEF)-like protein/PAS domain S-box-containing protein